MLLKLLTVGAFCGTIIENNHSKESTFTYSNRDRLLTETNPADGVISYTYDLRDRKTSMTDPRGQEELNAV